jgi:hypothetical protein
MKNFDCGKNLLAGKSPAGHIGRSGMLLRRRTQDRPSKAQLSKFVREGFIDGVDGGE